MKSEVVLMVSLSMASVAAAEPVNGGRMEFTGTITNTPCTLTNDSIDMNIELGQTSVDYLNKNMSSPPVNIDIHLKDCTLSGAGAGGKDITKAHVRFDSSALSTNDHFVLANTLSSGAQHVGVQILTGDGKRIVYFGADNTPDIPLQVTSTEQTLTFQARMTNIAQGEEVPTPGQVLTNATYIISYL